MFNNQIQDNDRQIQAINYEVVALQDEIHAKDQQIENENIINCIRDHYVDKAKNLGVDNVVMIVRKHTSKDTGE